MAQTLGDPTIAQDQDLITTHLEPHSYRAGLDEWRLKERGVPIWAIVGALTPAGDNAAQVAADYAVSPPAVEAARAYYRQHRALIDARLAANRAA